MHHKLENGSGWRLMDVLLMDDFQSVVSVRDDRRSERNFPAHWRVRSP